MAMQQNLYYQDPAASIGASLGRALFGDPQMAMKQAQMRSEAEARQAAAEEARAHAKLYASQTGAKDVENTANTGLPALFASMYATHPGTPARAPMGAESDDGGEIAATPGVDAAQAFRAGLPAMIAAMVQGGHGANVDGAVRALGAYGGDDEMARRALIAGGATPTKDFALTPERADTIAANDATAKLRQALGVATINNRDDIPVAQINAGSAARVAGINHASDIPVAQIAAGSREAVATIKGEGSPVADGRAAVLGVYPNARITDNVRDPNSALGRANPDSWHNHSKAAVDIAPMPGMTFENYIQGYRDKGYSIIEARNETGGGKVPWATGDNWHVVLGQPGAGKGGKTPAPKLVSTANMKALDAELAGQMGVADLSQAPFDTRTIANLRARAAANYQRTGNPVLAVQQSIQTNKDMKKAKAGAPAARPLAVKPTNAARPAGVPADARQRGDGKWFWKRGNQWFEGSV